MKILLTGLLLLSFSTVPFASETVQKSDCVEHKGVQEEFVLNSYYVSYDKIPEGSSVYCQLDIKKKNKISDNCSEFIYEYNGEESFGYYTMPKDHLCNVK